VSRTTRKAYTGSKRFSRACRNHGTCAWCTKGRLHKQVRQAPADERGQVASGYNRK